MSVWIDGNIVLEEDINDYIDTYYKNDEILLFPHPERICIYEEAQTCCECGKDMDRIINNQVDIYRHLGYPNNNGLFYGGFIVRNHNNKAVIDAMELWWDHINKYSYRDQISLPYVINKIGLNVDLSKEYIYANKWFKVTKHRTRE